MEVLPILSALRRNPVGAVLIVLQIALTLAIVCNALFIAEQQVQRMARPSGVDEANIFSFYNLWGDNSSDFKSRVQTDLATLRALPGVEDAMVTLGLPLLGGGYHFTVALNAEDVKGITETTLYPVDDHGLKTLGVHLVAGRWFTSSEVADLDRDHENPDSAAVVVVTQALATRLFPNGSALGRPIYLGKNPSTIIGIVEQMQASNVSTATDIAEFSVLAPFLWQGATSLYVVRAKPGQRDAVLQAAQKALVTVSRTRVLGKVSTFEETRADAYRPLRSMALILGYVSVLLLLITGLGIVGLTSYWVSQRRRQIGIRRALGARRIDILTYFHTENFLVVGVGAVIGVILANVANSFIVDHYEMARMPQTYIAISALIVLSLGQLSVLWPSLRAANISPVMATQAT
ncbi:ABC transporter permease [Dyella silvatica]|uniref:ABC transporter permease n=1 Tax=Dyella silvatica TaxID=2992128 RepID=UPI0022532035|nr:FtsX-like permease family protein [Dyella silvatica]